MKKQDIINALESRKDRSAWAKGVTAYAIDLLTESELVELTGGAEDEKALLNGANDWQQYSEGGCALVYNADIAKALCTPSELKKNKGGANPPNARESWIDCQSRALFQAWNLIKRTIQTA